MRSATSLTVTPPSPLSCIWRAARTAESSSARVAVAAHLPWHATARAGRGVEHAAGPGYLPCPRGSRSTRSLVGVQKFSSNHGQSSTYSAAISARSGSAAAA